MSKFYIMNKDNIVSELSFIINGVKQPIIFNNNERLLPISLKNGASPNDWLNSRLVLSHRKNVLEMFKYIGIVDIEDILNVTKGVSLNDTYWVKNQDSKLAWKNVSPYINPLNKEIANYSFTNSRIVDGKNITGSPDFATSGNFPKCWKRMNGKIYLIKGGSYGHVAAGNEPYSEIHAYDLARKLEIDNIKYEYILYKNLNSTKCANMCTESIGIYPINEVFPNIKQYSELLDIFKNDYNNFYKVLDMLLLDYLTLNTDRHFGNISVFVNNDTQQILGLTPIYDNNLAFLPTYLPWYDKSIENYISNLPFQFSTKTDLSFDDLFRLIDCSYIRKKLVRLKNFKFTLEKNRNDVATEVLKMQLSKIHR